jgi:transcription elongation factor Elf1
MTYYTTNYTTLTKANMNKKRKFVGIHFKCCNTYSRVYIDKQESAYKGACPRCGKRVSLQIGEGGTEARFFSAN